MPGARRVLLLGGVIDILIGLMWIGLMWIGLGSWPYQGSTFVTSEIAWAYRIIEIFWAYGGIVLAVLGVVSVMVASKMGGHPSS
jgi:hypothetical protein